MVLTTSCSLFSKMPYDDLMTVNMTEVPVVENRSIYIVLTWERDCCLAHVKVNYF